MQYNISQDMQLFYRRSLIIIGVFIFCLTGKRIAFADPSATGRYIIYVGKNCSPTEQAVCGDLKTDLEKVLQQHVLILPAPVKISGAGNYYLVGTELSNRLIHQLINDNKIDWNTAAMGKQGGMIASVRSGKAHLIILAGTTVEGEQNVVYDYCKHELDVDPLSYWTGYQPKINRDLDTCVVKNRIIPSPVVPIICYMENDIDELANIHKPYLEYDMPTWRGMVNSLRRMHYNAIQIMDMLGRAEFFIRAPYKKIRPNYHTNLLLVDSMINYAHLKGMKIQIDLGLGYQMRAITDSQAVCWSKYRNIWIQTWIYYLTKTPLGKADIYSLRPRNQIWDEAYVSSCGENKTEVFNDAFKVVDSLLNIYEPGAKKICICYDDGMQIFNGNFAPPKDFIIAWSDNGYGDFETLPKSTKGYQFGTYMHAGYWTNHTVHDPYPLKIDSVMNFMAKKYDALSYLEVNGQTFRPFLLNLQGYADWAVDPAAFNGEEFYKNWCTYYFGKKVTPYAIASMKYLHQAQFDRTGYVQNCGQIMRTISYLADQPLVTPHGTFRVQYHQLHFSDAAIRQQFVDSSLHKAALGLPLAKDQAHFYYDFVYLPALMYDQLLHLETTLISAAKYKQDYTMNHQLKDIEAAQQLIRSVYIQMKTIDSTCVSGDKNLKWKTWYYPSKRRPNNGFPTIALINDIQANLNSLLKNHSN